VQSATREATSATSVLYVPDRLLAYDRATGRGVVLNTNSRGRANPALASRTRPRQPLCQDGAARLCRSRGGRIPATSKSRRRALPAAICSRRCPASCFAEPCERSPAEVFQRLCRINPSPYGALMNLGEGEFSRLGIAGIRNPSRAPHGCPRSGSPSRAASDLESRRWRDEETRLAEIHERRHRRRVDGQSRWNNSAGERSHGSANSCRAPPRTDRAGKRRARDFDRLLVFRPPRDRQALPRRLA